MKFLRYIRQMLGGKSMTCPRCELGIITTLQLKKNSKKVKVCEVCDALWFENEIISINTVHSLASYLDSDGKEYSIERSGELDRERESIEYTDNK